MVDKEPILQMNARLAFYFGINASELSDEDFAIKWAELVFALKEENKRWQPKK